MSNTTQDLGLSSLSFEEALERLDQTVKAMELGGLSLSDVTRLFEEGMKLAQVCNDMLGAAELRISKIQTAYGEQMQIRDEDDRASTLRNPSC